MSGDQSENRVFVPDMWGGTVDHTGEIQQLLDSAAEKFAITPWARVKIVVIERIGPSFIKNEDLSEIRSGLELPPPLDLAFWVADETVLSLLP
jgi:hypothetical protein